METIYGIQVDTETLREAHEHQKRMQQKLQEQQNSATDTSVSASTKSNQATPATITRSTSTSALPPRPTNKNSSTNSGANSTGTATPHRVGSSATSPFLSATEHHAGPGQLRSTTQSPAFLSKFYEADHRLPGAMANVPWLSLPGTAAASTAIGAVESSSTFGRRRSDGSTRTSGTSTPAGLDLFPHEAISSQQENPHPQPPQVQHHGHHQHLLSPQDLTLNRNNSPMSMNEALPPYLRQKGVESLHSLERSRSSPGPNVLHPAPGSPFVLPGAPTSLNMPHGGASGNSSNSAQGQITSPAHFLFAFPGSSQNSRQDMERASSTGVLPINRSHHHHHSHLGTNIGASASAINLGASSEVAAGGSGQGQRSGTSTTVSFFRSSTPMATPSQLSGHGTTHTGSGGITAGLGATGFGSPFGHSNDQSFSSSNKEVHA